MQTAFWLLPEETSHKYLSAVIEKLSAYYKAPIFSPHLTLYAGEVEPKELETILKSMQNEPLELETDGLSFSPLLQKTLFIEFKYSSRLAQLETKLRSHLSDISNYDLSPHLSLIYKNISEVEKRKLSESIELPFSTITFNQLVAIQGSNESFKDLKPKDWKAVGEIPLKGTH